MQFQVKNIDRFAGNYENGVETKANSAVEEHSEQERAA
jgi:hypothetical protein